MTTVWVVMWDDGDYYTHWELLSVHSTRDLAVAAAEADATRRGSRFAVQQTYPDDPALRWYGDGATEWAVEEHPVDPPVVSSETPHRG